MGKSEPPSLLKALLLSARPKTLPVGAAPIVAATLLAAWMSPSTISWSVASICLATAISLQVLSNLANDYFDYQHGADTRQRSGPKRAMANGWLSRRQMVTAIAVVAGGSGLLGVKLIMAGGWIFALFGGLALLSALAYTGGPYPLGYHGLGDLFVFIFFGLLGVAGTYTLCTGGFSWWSLLVGGAVGALATNVLVVNNLRDEAEDRLTGKRTLVVRFGRRFGLAQLWCQTGLAVGVALLTAFRLTPWSALGLVGLWPLFGAYRIVYRQKGPVLNRALARVALSTFLYSALLGVGFLIAIVM